MTVTISLVAMYIFYNNKKGTSAKGVPFYFGVKFLENITFKLLANKDLSHMYFISGILGSSLTYAFGGWSGTLELLLWVFAIDYITGCAASIKEGKGLRSAVGFWGLFKKGLMLLMVFLGHRIDLALDFNVVMNGVIYFWLANELISIIENYGRCGLKTPTIFRKVIAILQEKSEDDKNNKDDINQ